MPLPPLYLQGLVLHARRDVPSLNTYKLGLIEALLKETLAMVDADRPPDDPDRPPDPVRANLRTALDVALWEPPRRP